MKYYVDKEQNKVAMCGRDEWCTIEIKIKKKNVSTNTEERVGKVDTDQYTSVCTDNL